MSYDCRIIHRVTDFRFLCSYHILKRLEQLQEQYDALKKLRDDLLKVKPSLIIGDTVLKCFFIPQYPSR